MSLAGTLARSLGLTLLLSAGWYLYQSSPRSSTRTYTVQPGDSLAVIAARTGTQVEDLLRWNQLDSDLIHPQQVLLLGESPPAWEGLLQPLQAWWSQRSASAEGNVEERPASAKDPSAAALSRPRSSSSQASSDRPEEGPVLVMPAPESCLAFDPELGDQGYAASAGLSETQIQTAMKASFSQVLRCSPSPEGSHELVFQLLVGCDGLVSGVQTLSSSSVDSEFLSCVVEVLKHADFPAHDMPDGMTFMYPMQLRF